MRKFTFSFKSLLVAAGLIVGSANAWAYDIPSGYEISAVFIGTPVISDATITSVTVEDYEGVSPDLTGWSSPSVACGSHSPALAIRSVTTVDCPDVNSTTSNGDEPETFFYPTYVSGKTLSAHTKNTSSSAAEAEYTFPSPITSGKIVFSGDVWAGKSSTLNNEACLDNTRLHLIDENGEVLFDLGFKNGGGYFTSGNTNLRDTENNAPWQSNTRGEYMGWGFHDMVIDIESGAVTFMLDFIDTSNTRRQRHFSINIGENKSVAKLRIHVDYRKNYELTTFIDNVSLYKVDFIKYTANFNETNGLNPAITIYSDSERTLAVDNGTLIIGKTYYYTAILSGYEDYEGSFTIEDANPSVDFTMNAIYNYTINAVDKNDNSKILSTLSSGYVLTSSPEINVYVPYYVLYGTTLYHQNTSNKVSQNITSEGQVINVQYEATDKTSVVYYSETENIAGLTTWHYSKYLNNMSNGASAVFSSTNITTLDAGVYTITGCAIGRTDDRYIDFYKNSVDDANKILRVTSKNDGGVNSETFTLTEETDIIGNGGNAGGDNGHACDYIYISKAPVNYTVKYKCGGVEIKDADASRTAVWGTYVTLTDADKENIIYNHASYAYSSDDASTTEIASDGSSVITVEFTQVPFYTLTDVTTATTWNWSVVTSGNAYGALTDETTPTKSTEFVLKNLELYGKEDGSSYSIPAGFGNAQQLEIIAQYPFRYESSKGMFQGNSIKFHTTVPGTVRVNYSNTGGSNDRPYRHVSVNGTLSATGSANGTAIDTEEIPVSAADVTITGYIPDASNPAERDGNNVGAAMLRIYSVTFTPASEIVKTSSENLQGYKTFYNADFNYQVDANTTIYKASASKTAVTLTSVESNIVPKNTPVILKTTNTTGYTMTLTPTLSDPTPDTYDGNALQVSEGTESNVFILAYTTAQGFGFYKYTSILDAGDIYLAIPSEAKMLRVVVDGTASEVTAPEVADVEEEEVLFNMAGVQVDKNFKGFVVNQKGVKRFNK